MRGFKNFLMEGRTAKVWNKWKTEEAVGLALGTDMGDRRNKGVPSAVVKASVAVLKPLQVVAIARKDIISSQR